MSYQLTERPHKFSFTKNPVRYLVQISNPDAPGCALEVELYALAINAAYSEASPGTLVTRQTLYPNPDGKTFFYIEDYLNSWLEWELPSTGNNDVKAVTKQVCKYYIRYRQVTTLNPGPAWATESGTLRIAIKGGISKEKFDRNNFFVNELPAKNPFLTWQPDKHFIGPEERRYLTYFHWQNTFPALFLKARVVYTDGAEDSATKAFPSLDDTLLFHLPAGLDQLGLYGLHPDKQVWYYDVSVEDGVGNVFANPYRMYADYRKYYDVFSFIYHNSLGGIDTLRIRGDYDVEIQLDKTDIQQATGGDFGEVLPTENAVINISKFEIYKGDAGWMNTRAFQDSCQELLLSDNVYRVVFNRWLRVVQLQKAQTMGASDDTKWSFPLQWRYTFDNSQYTPFEKDFGAGTNDEAPGPVYGICTAPIDLVAEFVEEVGGEVEYHFEWSPVGGAEGYELEYLAPGATEWTKVIVATPEANVTFNVEGEYSWRVRTKCGADDYSGYANGDGFVIDLTVAACSAPTNLQVLLLNILSELVASIKLQWTAVPGVVGYIVEFREVGDTIWSSISVATTSYTVPLFKDRQYEWRVKSQCDNLGNYSGYVYGNNFIPSNMMGTCDPPYNLQAEVITNSALDFFNRAFIRFTWSAPLSGGVTSYQIQHKDSTLTTWTIADVSTLTYTILVDKDRVSQWRVRSNCTVGGFSGFAVGDDVNS